MFISSEKVSSSILGKPVTSLEAKSREILLLIGPLIALIGNAASDVWMILVSICFLVYSVRHNCWYWTEQKWFRLALIFWAWIMLVSIFSPWPANAMKQAIPWIRFPIFAAALMVWLGESERLRNRMIMAIGVGVLIMTCTLLSERLQHMDVIRLYGTWDQAPKAGWYMLGFGLPIILAALARMKENTTSILWALPLIICLFGASLSTGEIYINISLMFASGLFILFSRYWSWPVVLVGCFAALTGFAALTVNAEMLHRFTAEVLVRLPWLPSSDYYDAWAGGLNVGFQHLIFGIGVDNYELYCNALKQTQGLAQIGVQRCTTHPHQLYIQVFAETGVPGLALLCAMAYALLKVPLQNVTLRNLGTTHAIALSILVLVFWPISTYSQAFGQHKNFFTWFLIGWALSTVLVRPKKIKKLRFD